MEIDDKMVEKLIEENQHVFDLRDKIGAACNDHYVKDIEVAMLMFLTNMYRKNIEDSEERLEQVASFCARMIMILKTFDEFEKNGDMRNLQ